MDELTLTPEEIRRFRDYERKGTFGPPPPQRLNWPGPRLLTAEEMKAHTPFQPPPRGVPRTREESDAAWYAAEAYYKLEKERISKLSLVAAAGADQAARRQAVMLQNMLALQYASQSTYTDMSEPLWEAKVVAVGDVGDSGLCPVLVRAPTPEVAKQRAATLWGLTDGVHGLGSDQRGRQELLVSEWQPAA
jgi:hypothetical protein